MRRLALTLIFVLSFLSSTGFAPAKQDAASIVTLLDRNGQPTTQITDGDSIRLQIVFPQVVTKQQEIHFLLDDTTVASCIVPSGNAACETDPFLSLGWYWNIHGEPQDIVIVHATANGGEIVAQSEPVTVKPRPVVMVHGFLSNPDTWASYVGSDGFLASLGLQGFAVGDGQAPGRLNTGNMFEPTGRTNTIGENAEILGQYIAGVKQKTGAQMVDLVVHSMGGMISRYYIDRVMQERDVAQLIMLGSPMGGSDCAVLPAALGFFLPASIEIRESYMRGIFNRQITHRRGIEFFDLAGTAIREPVKSPCTAVPNDTVVALDSVNAIPLQMSQLAEVHSNLTLSQSAFDAFVKPLLTKPTGTFLPAPDPASPPQSDSPLDFTRLYTGRVEFGGLTELTINVEPGLSVASFALYDASRSVNTVVRGASGNVIELSPETNGFIQVDDPSSMLYLGYGFQNPKPGPWRISVEATEKTPASGTDFAISVYFIGGAKLVATSNTLVPQINERVRFEAQLLLADQPLEITSAHAVIKDSNGNVETLNFPAGQGAAVEWVPSTPGIYAVDIVVTGAAPDGSPVERTDFLAIEVQPNPGKGQITFNLVAIIVGVVFVIGLILFTLFRWAGRLVRRLAN